MRGGIRLRESLVRWWARAQLHPGGPGTVFSKFRFGFWVYPKPYVIVYYRENLSVEKFINGRGSPLQIKIIRKLYH